MVEYTSVFLSQVTSSTLQSNNPDFQLYSLRQFTPSTIAYSSDARVQAADLQYIFGGSVQMEPTLPFVVFSLWQLAIPVVSTEWQIWKNQVTGIRPGFVTTEVNELQTMENGESAKEYYSGINLISEDTVVAYRVRPGQHVPAVTIETWDSPPVCSNIGYCFGTGSLVSSIYTSTVDDYNIPHLDDFLESEDVIFGELTSSMTEFYDHERDSASFHTYNRRRRYTHNYLGWNLPENWNSSSTNPTSLTLREWQDENGGDIYDHFAASPLAVTRRTISSSKCNAYDGKIDGHMCRFKAAFAIDEASNMRGRGKLITYPFVYSYEGTVSVVEGPVIVRVNEGCPEMGFDAVGGAVVASITNSLWTYLTIVIRTTTLDANCPLFPDKQVVLSPKQIYTIDVPPCFNTSFEILRDASGTLISCGAPITTTVDLDSQSTSVASFINNVTAVYIRNSVGTYTQAASLLITSYMDAVAYYSNPLMPPELQELSVYERDAQRNLTLEAYRIQLNALNAATNFTENLELISNLGQALRDLYNTSILRAYEAAQGGMVELEIKLAAQGQALSDLQQATAGYDAATRETIKAAEAHIAYLLSQKDAGMGWLISLTSFIFIVLVCGCCFYYAYGVSKSKSTMVTLATGLGGRTGNKVVKKKKKAATDSAYATVAVHD
jgi:hypothetical protein